MRTIWTTMGAVALIAMLTLGVAHAQEAAAPVAAPPPATDETAAPADGSKDYELTIEGKETEGEGHGVRITIGDDEDKSDLAGKVVDRVADKLEQSISGLPADVRRDIEPDVRDLRQALADIRELKSGGRRHHTEINGGDAPVEILIPIAFFICLVTIIAIISFNGRRKRQMVHETIDRIIAQGKDVPVELLDALDKGRNGKSMLQRGVINVAIGIGVAGMLYGMGGEEAASLGLIWFCVGLAQLLVWKLDKPRDSGATVS